MKKIVILALFAYVSISFIKGQSQKMMSLSEIKSITDSCSSYNKVKRSGPTIGISASNSSGATRLAGAYVDAVIKAGGMPIVIPVTTDGMTLKELVESLDGLILSGGGDVNPPYYKEVADMSCSLDIDTIRDSYELLLLKFANDRNIPLLGICRGQQLINVFFGGTLYQDIAMQYKNTKINHKQSQPREETSHKVAIKAGTYLSKILNGKKEISANSIHHQSVKNVAAGFVVSAVATDGIVEGIEALPNRNIIAVQWHPEALIVGGDSSMLAIFDFLVKKAETFREAKTIHSRIYSLDTHTDTPLCFNDKFNIAHRDSNQVNLPKMNEGYLDGVYMAAYLRQEARDSISSQKAVDKVNSLIGGIHRQVKMNEKYCGLAYSSADLRRLKAEGKKAVYIGIENGYGIGKDIKNLSRFNQMGATYMTLCHNYDNDICDAASKSKKEWGGLSPFGRKVVEEMNRLGMIIDISHVGEDAFWQIIKLSKSPIVATHSSAKALCNHPRNLTDDQLRAIAKNGGVVQVSPVDIFLNTTPKNASLEDFINHIDHIKKTAGIDHVGIGTDFDGGGGVVGCNGANDLINITVKFIERGYSEKDIEKIWGGNFLRVLDEVQGQSHQKYHSAELPQF